LLYARECWFEEFGSVEKVSELVGVWETSTPTSP
jgi:hypothetical protein